jgi:hypothetical protein
MNQKSFVEAEKEAKRFLFACALVREESKGRAEFATWPITGTAKTGALHRASMDLTRALANLRKP